MQLEHAHRTDLRHAVSAGGESLAVLWLKQLKQLRCLPWPGSTINDKYVHYLVLISLLSTVHCT